LKGLRRSIPRFEEADNSLTLIENALGVIEDWSIPLDRQRAMWEYIHYQRGALLYQITPPYEERLSKWEVG
jgi:hypothetical protein